MLAPATIDVTAQPLTVDRVIDKDRDIWHIITQDDGSQVAKLSRGETILSLPELQQQYGPLIECPVNFLDPTGS